MRVLALAATSTGAASLSTALPATARDILQIESPGGIKAWLVEEHSIPLISIKFALDGGAALDPKGKGGLAKMMTGLLLEGAGEMDAPAFARALAEQGADLSISSGRDRIVGGLAALTKRFGPSAQLLRLALIEPRFDDDAISRVREQHLGGLKLAAKSPRSVAFNRWYATAFPGHAYGRPADGTLTSVAAITRGDITGAHRRLFARNTLKIVIVGDIDRQTAEKTLDIIFGGLKTAPEYSKPATPTMRTDPTTTVVSMDQPLSTAAFGFASLPSNSPDYPALQILRQIIGSGDFDSILMEEIRVKRGLAYAAQVSLVNNSLKSVMLGGLATKNENMGKALGVLREVLATTVNSGPTREQFDNAKRYLIGSYVLDFDTNAKLAGSLLKIWLNGYGPDFIDARNRRIEQVTFDDVKRVARDVLRLDQMIVTIVGKPTLIP